MVRPAVSIEPIGHKNTTVIARLDRATQYSRAAVAKHERSGILDRPLSRTMTTGYASAFSRQGFARVLQITPPPKRRGRTRPSRESAGKTGCALHPRSHVHCASNENAHEHTGEAETLRPSLRNGLTAYTCSPW